MDGTDKHAMSDTGDGDRSLLAPPAVTALRGEDNSGSSTPMQRSSSIDIRKEREDLRAAAEQSLNVILDLGLDGTIRWVSESWKEIVGTSADSVKGKPIADLLLSSKDGFSNAIESMKSDDTKSRIIHFTVAMGPSSVLKQPRAKTTETMETQEPEVKEEDAAGEEVEEEEQVVNLEGQGIIVCDRSTGQDSHVSCDSHCNDGLADGAQDHVDVTPIHTASRGYD